MTTPIRIQEAGPMSSMKLRDVMRGAALALLLSVIPAAVLAAGPGNVVRIPVGHSTVLPSDEDVRTVAIAEPEIADAAVGSARTVIVTAKKVGSTNLVVYDESGRYRIYEVVAYVPNGDKQVLLHCTVAEVTGDALRELGLDGIMGTQSNIRGLDGSLSAGAFSSKLVSGDIAPLDPTKDFTFDSDTDIFLRYLRNNGTLGFEAAMKALETRGDVRTLANPSLLATSGQKATFLSGGEFAYQVVVGVGANATASVSFKEFGVRLEFTPTVLENGSIQLQVSPEVSEPDYSRSINGVPPLNSRKASTIVTLNPGEYLVIGGLKDTRTNKLARKIPVLGDLPVLGVFFRYSRDETTTKDLMVFLSPEIVQPTTSAPTLPTDAPETTKK
jgi:pilus assembly protein CpaC